MPVSFFRIYLIHPFCGHQSPKSFEIFGIGHCESAIFDTNIFKSISQDISPGL